jgi:hypothetical protein
LGQEGFPGFVHGKNDAQGLALGSLAGVCSPLPIVISGPASDFAAECIAKPEARGDHPGNQNARQIRKRD